MHEMEAFQHKQQRRQEGVSRSSEHSFGDGVKERHHQCADYPGHKAPTVRSHIEYSHAELKNDLAQRRMRVLVRLHHLYEFVRRATMVNFVEVHAVAIIVPIRRPLLLVEHLLPSA